MPKIMPTMQLSTLARQAEIWKMTQGGVATEIYSTNILDKDTFWNQELYQVRRRFLFSSRLACFRNWRHYSEDKSERAMIEKAVYEKRQSGLVGSHAHAVLATHQGFGKRLVETRNLEVIPSGSVIEVTVPQSGLKAMGSRYSDWSTNRQQRYQFWTAYEDLLKRFDLSTRLAYIPAGGMCRRSGLRSKFHGQPTGIMIPSSLSLCP